MTTAPVTHIIVLPGGGYASHTAYEAEPVASWLGEIGRPASVFRYPVNVRHPAQLNALRAEIARRRAAFLRLAHRGGPLRPARTHLPPRYGTRREPGSARRARVRPRPAQPRPGPERRPGRRLDHLGGGVDR